jgi:hypothetical protein
MADMVVCASVSSSGRERISSALILVSIAARLRNLPLIAADATDDR